MKLKVYLYEKCGSCRNAIKFLQSRGIPFTTVPIREQPPARAELKRMLDIYGGEIHRLFNTSGLEYKAQNLKDKLPRLTTDEALSLLAGNGHLVKRPFLLTEKGGLVGFKETEWEIFCRGLSAA